jgi:uncharacterized protein (DUF302 family)
MSQARQPLTAPTLYLALTSLFVLAAILVPAAANDPAVVTAKVEAEFEDVLDNVKSAIAGRGINIAHILPASEMLNRTAGAFGVEDNVFIEAQTVEFCSAKISHHLVQANPENILVCPFTISVYVLAKDPTHVRVSYRRPYLAGPDAANAVQETVGLVEGIVDEATAW